MRLLIGTLVGIAARAVRQSGEVSNRDSNRDYHKSAVRHSHKDSIRIIITQW